MACHRRVAAWCPFNHEKKATQSCSSASRSGSEDTERASEHKTSGLTTDLTLAGGRAADAMAIGILRELRQHDIRVPEDISVAGFDDVAVAADVAPALTTVRIPMFEMGQHAVALILRPSSDEARIVETGHELIVRRSSGPPRA